MIEASNSDNSTTAETSVNNASALIYSGRLHARTGHYSKAIDDLQHATCLEPTNYEAFYYLGLIYIKRKKYKDARNVLKTAISNDSTTSRTDLYRCYFKYAFACQMDNQFKEAITYYTKFIENVNENNQYPGLLNRGICYDKLERYNAALRDFDCALKLTNGQGKPYCLSCRAKVKTKINDHTGALKDYDQAVTHAAAFIEQNGILGNVYTISSQPFSSKHVIPMTKLLEKFDPYSPFGILLNALEEDNVEDSVNAMHDYNRLLDTKVEELQEQIRDLDLKKQSERDTISKANLILETIDKHQAAMEKFANNDNLKTFYCSIYFKLEEIFIACKSIASGKVKPVEGKFGEGAEFVTLVGEVISVVPVVGAPVSLFAKPIAKIAQAIDYTRQKNTMMKIANFGCTLDLWKTSQSVAEKLTVLYELLLLQLILPEQEKALAEQVSEGKWYDCCAKPNWWECKCLKKTKRKILKEEMYMKQAREIGEYALVLILNSLLNEKIVQDNIKPLDQQLIDAVCIPSDDQKETAKNVKSLFSKRQILTQNPKMQWTLDGFYHEPGIITSDGEHYYRTGANSELYGYRNGTKEEAIRLGFVPRVSIH